MSSYTLTLADHSYCPMCGKHPVLLADADMSPMSSFKPAFYICFDCRFIGEVGKGPVEQS